MTERKKMLSGLIYDSRDPELLSMYHHAKALLHQYDQADSQDSKKKYRILQQLLGRIGDGVWIERTFSCDYGKHIFIGDNTFINYNCVFIDVNNITIGENVLIGPAVQIYTATHPVPTNERIIQKEDGSTRYTTYSKPVSIGNNVWIGGGSIICPGVTIGDNTVIGAGSVVTKNIPSDCVAFGNPCRVVQQEGL